MKEDDIRQYVVTREDAHPYSPPAHTDTTNLLYFPKGKLGSKQFEVVLGMPRRGGGGEPHFHEEAEQMVFVLAGHGETEIEGVRLPIGPGTMIYHPAGQLHRELAQSDDFQVLVIYSPGIGVKDSESFRMREAQEGQDS
jgi:quercetin dioxygenase-like cupin family protein